MNIIKNTIYLTVSTFAIIGFVSPTFAQYGASDNHKQHGEMASEEMPVMDKSVSHDDAHASMLDLKYLKHAESKYICMVNNKLFDKVQIPTEVNGKIYYGCCSMCKDKLEKSQELRQAVDPISGKVVDKASAVIGTGPDRTAYYFENEENMKKFDDIQSSKD